MQLPTLNIISQTQKTISKFYGYNHNPEIGEGELYDMENLTSDYYPMLASRRARKYVVLTDDTEVEDMTATGYVLYRTNGNKPYTHTFKDLTWESGNANHLVTFGAYVLIFPDAKYYNTADGTYGDMTTTTTVTVNYDTSTKDGTQLVLRRRYPDGVLPAGTYIVGGTGSPVIDMLWIDGTTYKRCVYVDSDGNAEWQETQLYSSFDLTGIGVGISAGESISISGTAFAVTGTSYDGEYTVIAAGDDYIAVEELKAHGVAQNSGEITVKTFIPDMDFVIECQNRLWGCKYGMVGGEMINEVYASKLGSFKAWRTYAGISTDAWAASIGHEGVWTGAIAYDGYPIFFKADRLYKIYISSVGAHQIKEIVCDGVAEGSSRSLAVVDNILYYFSNVGVMVYDGTQPTSIFSSFGPVGTWRYEWGRAAGFNSKYYINLTEIYDTVIDGEEYTGAQRQLLFIYDTKRGLWHREYIGEFVSALGVYKNVSLIAKASVKPAGGEAYEDRIYSLNGSEVLPDIGGDTYTESPVPWWFETGVMGYSTVPQKYIARIVIRMQLPVGSEANVYIEYDSSGKWEKKAHIKGRGLNSFDIPIIPRRCDHFRLKMDGKNEIKIYTISRIEETGSEIP